MIFWFVCSIPGTVGPADSDTRRINYYEQRPVVSMVSIIVKCTGWSMWICAVLSERWFNAEPHLRRFVSNVVKMDRNSGAQTAFVLRTHFTDSTIVAFLIVINITYVALCTHRIFSLARASHLSKQFRQSHDGVKSKINTENEEPDSPLFRLCFDILF